MWPTKALHTTRGDVALFVRGSYDFIGINGGGMVVMGRVKRDHTSTSRAISSNAVVM